MAQLVTRHLGKQLLPVRAAVVPIACHSTGFPKSNIGKREIVGFGINGTPLYVDNIMFPMQAIRFREPTPEIVALQQKEKGDWKKLSIDEKKTLYRHSFCQTFAEMGVKSGAWKYIWAGNFLGVTISIWICYFMQVYIFSDMPSSLTTESRTAQLKRMIDMRVDPIEGVSSKWDYEKNRWKD